MIKIMNISIKINQFSSRETLQIVYCSEIINSKFNFLQPCTEENGKLL